MAPGVQASILHADLDAFYASVEQLLDPRLRGKPVAVGGGVVLAASYEAKAFGVQSGMPGWRARQLCPSLRLAGGHFREYRRLGDEVVELYRDFTPLVERVSIDEAFLDVSGAVHLFGAPADIGRQIRRRVRSEIGLAVSVGVAASKHLAKVASQVAKPDGIVVVEAGDERTFLRPLPVRLVSGVGAVTKERLDARGIRTIGQLADTSPSALQRIVGRAAGEKLASLAADVDPRRVQTERRARSVGAQSALGRRPATPQLLRSSLGHLADRVAARLRAAGRAGRTVTVRVRFPGLRSVTRSATLAGATSTTLTLTEVAVGLAQAALADNPGEPEITLVAISVSNLVDQTALQLELPLGADGGPVRPGSPSGAARWALDRSVDEVRARFGRDAVAYAAAALSGLAGAPDGFRELAERDP